MKLYMKLFSLIFIGIIATFSLNGILQIRQDTNFFKEEIRHDAMLLGHVLTTEISNVWKNGDISRVKELVHDANRKDARVRFRWVRFDVTQDVAETSEVKEARKLVSSRNAAHIIEKVDASGEMRAYSYFPVPLPGSRQGGLEISESLSGFKQYTRNKAKHVIIVGALLLIITGISLAAGTFWLLAKPLHSVIQRTRDIHGGHLSGSLHLNRRDEMGELATSINNMTEQLLLDREKIKQEMQARIEALEQLRHADRLRSVGRLASGVAHELGTPLNVISGRAGLIVTDESASREIIGSAETIRGQCQRMTLIIRQLLDFARRSVQIREPSDLNTIVSQTTALLKPLALKQRVRIDYNELEYPAIVMADSSQIEQVLTNLLTNAVQAMPDGGQISMSMDKTHTRPPEGNQGEKEFFVIRIRDDGTGISPDDLPYIFDPFFTTKDTGEGTGLGLSIAYGIVQDHGGWIEINSELGNGSTFSVYLPAEETNDEKNSDCR